MPSSFTDLPPLLTLPTEIQMHVVSFIQDPRTFAAFSAACQDTYYLLRDPIVLQKTCYRVLSDSSPLKTDRNSIFALGVEQLKQRWMDWYKLYRATQPLLTVIKDLQDFQNSWLADLQKEKRKEIGVLTQQKKKEGLEKLLSDYEVTKGKEMQNKLDATWHEAGLSGDFTRYLSVEKVKNAVNLLFKNLIIKFVRLMAKKEAKDFSYREIILRNSDLHAWALTALPGGNNRFLNVWMNQLVKYNNPDLILTIFHQAFFQKLLKDNLVASRVGAMIDSQEEVVLAIWTDPALRLIKERLFKSNERYIIEYAIKFPTVAQYVLSQPEFIQAINASELQQICVSHANFFKLFELPDSNHEEKLYYLFMLQPEMAFALGQLEEDFKAYQQEPEIALFLSQQGMTSFYHFLSQMAEYTTDSTFSFKASHPIYPKAVKFLDTDFLNRMNLSALSNAENRKAVMEGELSLKTLVTNTPNTASVDTQFRSLRLSP